MVARLKRFLLRSKVEIERLPWRGLALRGAQVGQAAAGLLTVLEEGGVLCLPFAWNGWTGMDLLGPKDVILDPAAGPVPEGIISCDRDAVEACRIASGIPAMGSELTDKTIAAETGLVERAVSFTKGCYTGQELVARLDARGNNVPRRLVGVIGGSDPDPESTGRLAFGMTLHAGPAPGAAAAPDAAPGPSAAPDAASGPSAAPDAAAPDAVTPDAAAPDAATDKVVGTITSATWSPELASWVALAYLHRTVKAPGPVRVRSGDGLGGAVAARVALLPMVPGPGG